MRGKLLILSLLTLTLSAQVPNTESFSLQNVVTELGGVGATAKVDKVTKNSISGDCYVSCNGYGYLMTWNTSPTMTIAGFVSAHSGGFGAVSLSDNLDGSMLFTGSLNFADATISGGYGTAVNLTAYDAGSPSDLLDCFNDAVVADFDSRYYPYYLVLGDFANAHNTLLNFRNYNGTPKDGIPIPVATAATYITYNAFTSNGLASVGGTTFFIDVSEQSDFSTFVTGYEDTEIAWLGGSDITRGVGGLGANMDYYYRFRAGTPNGVSGNSNTITLTTAAYTSAYHDWHLATINDLSAMRNLLYLYGLGAFSSVVYWSSEGVPGQPLYAYGYNFGINMQGQFVKTLDNRVRGVRSFVSSTFYDRGDTGQGGLVFNGTDNGDGTYTWYECTPVDLGIANWADAQTICNNL